MWHLHALSKRCDVRGAPRVPRVRGPARHHAGHLRAQRRPASRGRPEAVADGPEHREALPQSARLSAAQRPRSRSRRVRPRVRAVRARRRAADGEGKTLSISGPGLSGRQDLNLRPLAPQASALPGCATPRVLRERIRSTADFLGQLGSPRSLAGPRACASDVRNGRAIRRMRAAGPGATEDSCSPRPLPPDPVAVASPRRCSPSPSRTSSRRVSSRRARRSCSTRSR
jgi:hypothetical protein